MRRFQDLPGLIYHFKNAPDIWSIFGLASIISSLISLLLATPFYIALVSSAVSQRKHTGTVFLPCKFTLYGKLVFFGPLLGIASCFSILTIRFSLMFDLIVALYEAATVLWIWNLAIAIIGTDETCFLRFASRKPAYRVLSAFPFCLPVLFQLRGFKKSDLLLAYALVAQYATITLLTVLAVAISQGSVKFLKFLSLGSLVGCIYGLTILFKAGKPKLSDWRIGMKFACLKITFTFIKLINLITILPGVVTAFNDLYNEHIMAIGWRASFLSLLSVGCTLALVLLFPVSELLSEPHLEETETISLPGPLKMIESCSTTGEPYTSETGRSVKSV